MYKLFRFLNKILTLFKISGSEEGNKSKESLPLTKGDIKQIKQESIKLVSYDELPSWLQFNVYIRNYNRSPCPSFSACLKSIFYMHSETINIWSHLIGKLKDFM